MKRVASGAVDAIVLHHILSVAYFQQVADNLRESFRSLAGERTAGNVSELPGISIASLGVAFQMFNAAFLNAPVHSVHDLEWRLDAMGNHFRTPGRGWSLWICEDWLDASLHRKLSRLCQQRRLRPAAEMPGMRASALLPVKRKLPQLEYRRVDCTDTLTDFRAIGALCFYVPPDWFAEVFDERILSGESRFIAWVAYDKGLPVATAATVRANGAVGLYNIASIPSHRHKGVAEAITRYACAQEERRGPLPLVLQATSQGFRMYQRMGFEAVTRIVVYNSW